MVENLFEGKLISISQLTEYANLCYNSYSRNSGLEMKITARNLIENKDNPIFEKPLYLVLKREVDCFSLGHGYVELDVEDEAVSKSIYDLVMQHCQEAKPASEKLGNILENQENSGKLVSSLGHILEEYKCHKAFEILNQSQIPSILLSEIKLMSYFSLSKDGMECRISQKYSGDAPDKELEKINYDNTRIQINFELEKGQLKKTILNFKIAGLNWFDTFDILLRNIIKSDYTEIEVFEKTKSVCSDSIGMNFSSIMLEACRRIDESCNVKEKKAPNPLCRGLVSNFSELMGYFLLVDNAYKTHDPIGINISSSMGEVSLFLQRLKKEKEDDKEAKEGIFRVTHVYFDKAPSEEENVSNDYVFAYQKIRRVLRPGNAAVKCIGNAPLGRAAVELEGFPVNTFLFKLNQVMQSDTQQDLEKIPMINREIAEILKKSDTQKIDKEAEEFFGGFGKEDDKE